MRTDRTTDSVQLLPGEYHSKPFTKLSVMPMIIAPITAPTRLSIPPRTTAVNAIRGQP
jgi:hypothetical protein